MIRLDIPGRESRTFDDLDAAMYGVFELFPKADFSFWNDSNTEVWMDIYAYDNGPRVGRLIDLENI
jgi:hypothetical protein